MPKYLDIRSISSSNLNTDFFPFFSTEKSLLKDVDSTAINSDFPDLKEGGSFPLEALEAGVSIEELVKELEGEELKRVLENKFDLDLQNKIAVTTLRGYSRERDGKIHTDSTTKIVTVLLYLNLEWSEKNAHLRLLKDDSSLENYIQEVPCTFGSMVAFKVTDNCWHGFLPFEGKRLSVQLNYIQPNALNLHNFRHKTSSLLKRFKTKIMGY
jgi:SM-20-related protein